MSNTITNDDDIIDSRDIIDRIEDLENTLETLNDNIEAAQEAYAYHDSEDTKSTPEWNDLQEAKKELDDWLASEEAAELEALKALAKQGESESSDWIHGEILIHRRYWVDYVAELLADCGDLPKNLSPWIEIDWEATAGNIEADYVSIDFDGQEYLIRSC